MNLRPETRVPTAGAPQARSRVARGGVLVLGGGFAGSYVARGLGRNGATIVNPTNYMLYTPLLPEAAGGGVEPRHSVVPLRTMCPHADLVLGSAVSLDAERRVVEVDSEAGRIAIAYAELVVALGSVSVMPPVPGLQERAVPLKDLPDAIALRNHVLRQVELAGAAPDTAPRRLTFVVAGAGFTGVEVVSELHELVEYALRGHRRLAGLPQRWVLLDGAPRILGQTPERLAAYAATFLRDRGIEVLTGTTLESVDERGVVLSGGRRVETETVVWTAGVRPHPLVSGLGLPTDPLGRLRVDETLRVSGAPHVWALGDCTAVPNAASGATDPATCQHALRQARRLVGNLLGTPRPYAYRTRGQMATLGRRHGIVAFGALRLRGRLGWLVARAYHLFQLPFASRRMRVTADWITASLFPRDISELTAVGDERPRPGLLTEECTTRPSARPARPRAGRPT